MDPSVAQQDVARYLLLAGQASAQQDGLAALLHALRLGCALRAEQGGQGDQQQRLALRQLQQDCGRLLAAAGASKAAAEAR